ncbi:von Willebrand factor type A domain protein [Peptostreptococcaceae bacterium AS15]|nr:von Willebrand factor type A domain protein [Peptostreptococcaceae bacterium AS15]
MKRQEIANYIKKHIDNGAKLQGYITVGYGLKDMYEPSESSYLNGKKQIRYVPLIKITGLTYDVELEYINAPTQAELPKIIQVNAVDKIKLPEIKDYISVYYDDNNKRIDGDFTVEKNMKIIVKFLNLNDTTDTDSDGLVDVLEELVGTSLTDKDTDSDGLSDSFEVFAPVYNVFNPLIADTDSNGINDGDEDYDEDGLKNKEEIENKTSAFDKDTDGDELEDGEEVYKYKTNPTKIDTDGDGLDDFKEIQLGFNPLVANEKFDITYAPKIDNDTVSPSVKITLSGEQAQSLSIEQYDNEMLFPKDMPGYMGMAYDFNVNGSFDEAVISFGFDKTNLPNDAEPTIYYYNEKEGSLEELPTTVVGNIASAKVNHFSTYILINRKVYNKIFSWEEVWEDKNYNKVDIAFIIDDSYSMKINDSEYRRLEAARNLIDKLPQDSGIGIVSFSDSKPKLHTSKLTTNKSEAKKFLTTDYFTSGGDTYMYTAILEAFSLFDKSNKDTFKMMVVLSDGETYDKNLKEDAIKAAKNKDIRIYTVGLGKNSLAYFDNYLKPLATETNGGYYSIDKAENLNEVFKNINKKIDITLDSDKDGLPDFYERGIHLLNGKTIITDEKKRDTDGDGLLDGEELKIEYKYTPDKKKVKVTGKMLSYPTQKDSDEDGDLDKDDPHPMRYLLNDRFIDNLGKLEKLSKEYYKEGIVFFDKYTVSKNKWYVFMFLRQFNPSYISNKWSGTGGNIDTKFVDYVKSQDEELYKYFATKKEIYANKQFETLDVYHMAATMTGLIYNTDSLDAPYFKENSNFFSALIKSNTPQGIVNNLSGWAGDLQTLMRDLKDRIYIKKEAIDISTYENFYFYLKNMLLSKKYSFSKEDMYADIDAYNINNKLKKKSIKEVFEKHYSEGYKKRFTNFLGTKNKDKLRDEVYFYTYQYCIIKMNNFNTKWPLLGKYNYKTKQSKAARDVFVDFIIAQREKEK